MDVAISTQSGAIDPVSVAPQPDPQPDPLLAIQKKVLQAWDQRITELPQRHRERFALYDVTDIVRCVKKIEDDCKAVKNQSRSVRIMKRCEKVTNVLNNLMPAASSAAALSQVHPNPSQMVLGGVMCLLHIGNEFLNYHEKTFEILDQMIATTDILKEFSMDLYSEAEAVQLALVEVFADVVEFCTIAMDLYLDDQGQKKSQYKTWGKAIQESFESRCGSVLRQYHAHMGNYELLARLHRDHTTQEYFRRHDQHMELERFAFGHLYRLERDTNRKVTGIASTLERNQMDNDRLRLEDEQRQQQRRILQEIEAREERIKEERKERKAILEWLHIPGFQPESSHRKKCKTRLFETCHWILEATNYKAWKEGSSISNLLWVSGPEGHGKSILASAVIDDLKRELNRDYQGKEEALVFIYCQELDSNQRNFRSILWACLRALSEQYKGIDPQVEKLFNRVSGANNVDISIDAVQKAIESIIPRFQAVNIVIDGLDECTQQEDISEYLISLVQKLRSCKLIVFSRPEYKEIREAFKDSPKLAIDAESNKDDIKKFVQNVLQPSELQIEEEDADEEFLETIRTKVQQKAEGMFLWVQLVVNNLRYQYSRAQIEELLHSFPVPKELAKAYSVSMTKLERSSQTDDIKEFALRTLLWIVNTHRPLSKDELLEAIVIQLGVNKLDKRRKLSKKADLVSWCAGLIKLEDDGRFRLLHSSLRDFLTTLSDNSTGILKEYRSKQTQASKIISNTCLTTLLFVEDQENVEENSSPDFAALLTQHPLLSYAASFWVDHFDDREDDFTWSQVTRLVTSDRARTIALKLSDVELSNFGESTTSFHAICFWGLSKLIECVPGVRDLKLIADKGGSLPLDYAFLGGRRNMALYILNETNFHGQNVLSARLDLLHFAASLDWVDVIDRLIVLGYDVNTLGSSIETTALGVAAFYGSDLSLNRLLLAGADADLAGLNEDSPLAAAIEGNNERFVPVLIQHNANIDRLGRSGYTALHIAALKKNASAVRELLESGANALADIAGPGSWKPIHCAVSVNWVEGLQIFLNHGGLKEILTRHGETPFFLAAEDGALDCLKLLVRSEAVITTTDVFKRSPIHGAAANGHTECVEYLVDLGLNVDTIDEDGDTPLHTAVRSGKIEAVRCLLALSCKKDVSNKTSHIPLHLAIMSKDISMSKLLIDKGSSITSPGSFGSLAVHYAAVFGCKEILDICFEKDPACLFAKNWDEATPLHYAASNGYYDCVQRIIDVASEDDISTCNKYKKTPLHLAASNGHLDVVKLLRTRTTNIPFDTENDRPIHLAALHGYDEIVRELLTPEEVQSKGYQGQSPLHKTCFENHVDTAMILVRAGAAIDACDAHGSTPLLYALDEESWEMASYLLENGASIHVKTTRGCNPLHLAALRGSVELVTQLLAKGCDDLATTNKGSTPLAFAVEAGHLGIVRILLLKESGALNILNESGQHCIHIAAFSGSESLVRELVNAKTDLKIKDSFGNNALWYAAASGDLDTTKFLLEAGLHCDGEQGSLLSPLYYAAANGFPKVVELLLKTPGLDYRPCVFGSSWTPLMVALSKNHLLVLNRLIVSGAGWSTADERWLVKELYTLEDLQTLRICGADKLKLFERSPGRKRATRLRLSSAALDAIIKIRYGTEAAARLQRLMLLEEAGEYLRSLSDDSYLEPAKSCFMESIFTRWGWLPLTFSCSFCEKDITSEDLMVCMTCVPTSTMLCVPCYEANSSEHAKHLARRPFETLYALECQTIQVLRSGITIFDTVELFGLQTLVKVLNSGNHAKLWFEETKKQYDKWKEEFGNKGGTDPKNRIGYRTVTLIQELQEIDYEKEESSELEKRTSQRLTKELKSVVKKLKLGHECSKHKCSIQHEYFKISYEDYKDRVNAASVLNAEGRLEEKWIRDLIDRLRKEADELYIGEEDDYGVERSTDEASETEIGTERHLKESGDTETFTIRGSEENQSLPSFGEWLSEEPTGEIQEAERGDSDMIDRSKESASDEKSEEILTAEEVEILLRLFSVHFAQALVSMEEKMEFQSLAKGLEQHQGIRTGTRRLLKHPQRMASVDTKLEDKIVGVIRRKYQREYKGDVLKRAKTLLI